jgi:DNA-binding CsgD family transcriptional regulator
MTKRGPQEPGSILPVLKEFFSSKSFQEFGDYVSCHLARMFSGEGSLFAPFKGNRLDPAMSIRSGLCESQDAIKLYMEYFYQLDPFVIRPFTPYPDKVYTDEDVIKDEGSFLRSEYYNDFLKRFSSRNNLFINLGSNEQRLAQIVIMGDNRKRRFGAVDRSLARLIEPSLTAALERVFLLNRNSQVESIVGWFLEKVQLKGVAELDDSLHPVRTNKNWDVMTSALYREREVREGLPEAVLSKLRSHINDVPSGRETILKIKLPDSTQNLLLSVEQPASDSEETRYLVLLEFEHPLEFASQQMRRYRLTEREIEITSLVCDGLENGEIADRLCISEYTVINHMRHIFEKSNVRSRTELLRRVLDIALSSSEKTLE